MIELIIKAVIDASTPILLGGLGEIFAERSGVINLGLEGIMMLGATAAFIVSLFTGDPLLGIIIALFAGGLMSLVHGFVSISLRGNQIVSGIALSMFGIGLSSLIGDPYIGNRGVTLSPIRIPILSNIPILGPAIFSDDIIVYSTYVLVPIFWFLLYKTKIGLEVRSVGDTPRVAESLGINVYLTRYLCVFFGGMMSGLAGAYLSLSYIPAWTNNMTAGRGWIAVALAAFSLWDPLKAMIGAYLFGSTEALQYFLQPIGLPASILAMLPYLITIIALSVISVKSIREKIGAPKALGEPYPED